MTGSRSALAVAVCAALLLAAMAPCATARRLTVGSPFRWSIDGLINPKYDPTFFQDWAAQNGPFHTTDELEFQFVVPTSLLLVNFADFTSCITSSPINSWFADPNGAEADVVLSLQPYPIQTLYFISGDLDNCKTGLRVAIDVLD